MRNQVFKRSPVSTEFRALLTSSQKTQFKLSCSQVNTLKYKPLSDPGRQKSFDVLGLKQAKPRVTFGSKVHRHQPK
jgi:hypothetical protein